MPATMPRPGDRVRLLIDMSPNLDAYLEQLAAAVGGTKADVFKKAIALFGIAVQATREGKKIGVAHPGQELDTEIVGL